MERELVALLGAGLTAVATGFGVSVPVGAIDRGYLIADVMSREGGPRISATLNTFVQNLWLTWENLAHGRAAITVHAGALPAILELNRPSPAIFSAARQHPDGGRLLAVEVIERARQTGDIQRAELDEAIAFQLLETLFQVILAEGERLPEMTAAVNLCLQAGLWREGLAAQMPVAAAAPTPAAANPEQGLSALTRRVAEPVKAAEPVVTAVPAGPTAAGVAALLAVIDAQGARIADREAAIADASRSMSGTIARMVTLARQSQEASPPLLEGARHLADGDFKAADKAFGAAQELFVRRAPMDLSTARQMMYWAADVIAARAEVETLCHDYRKAARHYRAALRCFNRTDLAPQLHFLNLHARCLLEHDKIHKDDAAFAEGLKSLVEACALPPSQVDPRTWAHANLRLAHLHIDLANRSGNPQDFLAAGRHAGQALPILLQLQQVEDIISAHLVQAQAFWRAGDGPGDATLLAGSVAAFKAALDLIARENDPVRWVDSTGLLGQVLLRLATVRGEPKLLSAAIEQLRGAVQYATTCRVPLAAVTTDTALGRALLAEYAAGGQPLLLDLAATAFRRAIKAANAEKAFARKGELQHELGMTLWAMAERASDAYSLSAAEETLEAAVETLKGAGLASAVASAQADLGRLRQTTAYRPNRMGAPSSIQYL